MAKAKRKSKPGRATHNKKKSHEIKLLKKKHGAKKATPKKAKKLLAKKPAVAPKAQAPKADDKKKGKVSAKQALELLEANVAAVKAKGKGRPGRKGKKDAWLIPPELPKEDA